MWCPVSGSHPPAVMRRRVAQGQTDQGWRCLSAASLARPRHLRAVGRTTRHTSNLFRFDAAQGDDATQQGGVGFDAPGQALGRGACYLPALLE